MVQFEREARTDDDIPPDVRSTLRAMNGASKQDYDLAGRLILFALLVVLIGVVSLVVFVPPIFNAGARTATDNWNLPLLLFPLVTLLAVAAAAILVFKR